MRQTDKSLQSDKFKQVVGGWENHEGKSPPPTRSDLPEIRTGHPLAGPDRDISGPPPGVCCPQLSGHAPSSRGTPRPLHNHDRDDDGRDDDSDDIDDAAVEAARAAIRRSREEDSVA